MTQGLKSTDITDAAASSVMLKVTPAHTFRMGCFTPCNYVYRLSRDRPEGLRANVETERKSLKCKS